MGITKTATLRFYAELKDFVTGDQQSGLATRRFDVPGSLKHVIESCGARQTEVDLLEHGVQTHGYVIRSTDPESG